MEKVGIRTGFQFQRDCFVSVAFRAWWCSAECRVPSDTLLVHTAIKQNQSVKGLRELILKYSLGRAPSVSLCPLSLPPICVGSWTSSITANLCLARYFISTHKTALWKNMQSSETTHCALGLLYFLKKYLLYNQCNKHKAGSPILFQPDISRGGKKTFNLAKTFMTALLSNLKYISQLSREYPQQCPPRGIFFKKEMFIGLAQNGSRFLSY